MKLRKKISFIRFKLSGPVALLIILFPTSYYCHFSNNYWNAIAVFFSSKSYFSRIYLIYSRRNVDINLTEVSFE